MTREKAIETINEFPKEFELAALFERLLFIDSVEKGLQQIRQGDTVPHEEVEGMIEQLRNSGAGSVVVIG